ncbi:MAG TPA: TolC family protein, partial [Candidatus Krumholzibacterium sp.]|nr:TolC family protein [Candidatus Krumholzibacterium sp.]
MALAESVAFDTGWSLDDYISYALRNNPGLRSAYYGWRAELEKAGEAGYFPDPVLSFGYFIESVETRVGPQRYRLGLRQSIPWPGRLSAKKDVALKGASARYQSFLSSRAAVILRVRTSWLEFYRAGRMVEIIDADLALLGEYESVALAGYRAGVVPH